MVRCGWIEITSVAIAALFFVKSFAERSVENAASFDTAIEKLLGGPFLPFPSDEELMESNRYSCDDEPEKPPKKTLNIRGTSLGGWLVLEPWITPSLFYQFLGATDGQGRFQGNVALDSYTFCEVLGGKEANRQLRIHWRYWVTERQIRNLAELGLNTVRIPIADWMFAPYYPFTNGCWEGALEELDRVVDLCQKYGLDVLLDMHAVRGSQNGLDNSGDTRHYEWINGTHFRHWDIRGGDWAGQYDAALRQYVTTNETQLLNTLAAIQQVALRYANRSAVVGLQPVNEPWDAIPWPVVREFYWRSYRLLRHLAPNWIVMFHDSFRLGTSTDSVWLAPHPSASASKTSPRFKASKGNGRAEDQRFLAHCTHYMVDIHVYQAWAWDPYDVDYFLRTTCDMGQRLRRMEDAGIAVVVGEWSLATDNCAMWLNGLNDNVPGYPKAACQRVPCPAPYFPAERARIPNAPVNRSAGRQGPFGLGGDSYVEYGTCVVDSTHNRCNVTAPSTYNTSELLQRIQRQGAAAIDDDTLALVRFYRRNIVAAFAAAQWSAFNLHTHGQFFWNFRTELEDTWDIQRATAPHLQWLPRNMSAHDADAQRMAACGCVGYDHGDAADKPLPPGDEDYWLFSAASASAQALWVMVAVVVVGLALSAGLWLWCRPACADRPDESHSLCRCLPHWLSTGPLSWWSDTFRGHRGGYSSIASAGVLRDYGDEATSVEVYVQPSSYRRVSAGGAPPTSSTTDDSKVELMPLTAVNKAAHDRRYKELEETGGGYVKPYAFSYQRASHTSNQT